MCDAILAINRACIYWLPSPPVVTHSTSASLARPSRTTDNNCNSKKAFTQWKNPYQDQHNLITRVLDGESILCLLLTAHPLEEALNSVWTLLNLLGTSFGLTISVFVTAVQDELPLYQVIIPTDLVWLANWAIFMAHATYNRHPRGSHAMQYTTIRQTYISMALILLVVTTLLLIGYTVIAARFLKRRFLYILTHKHQQGLNDKLLPLHRRGPRRRLCRLLPWLSPRPRPHPRLRFFSCPQVHARATLPHSQAPGASASAPTRLPPSLALDPHLIILGFFILLPYVVTVLSMTVTIVPVVVTPQAGGSARGSCRTRRHMARREGHLLLDRGGSVWTEGVGGG
ncbi:hypothetical protein B0H13DRAFT_2328041 [Mycena leptocephala]|nr:hypothetical protein B0H13DRAFT_2328041 [Mycena leptocephala]